MSIIKHACCILFITVGLLGCDRQEVKHEITKQTQRIALTEANFNPINWKAMLKNKNIPVYSYKILHQYPHDINSFTEGLIIDDHNNMFESIGLYKKSRLKQVDLKTGKTIREHFLAPQYFAEGMTILNDRIYQLTYQENIGFIYDKATFKPLGTFRYPGQGWGLTNDGKYLIMSDGSSALTFLDPHTFAIHHVLYVHYQQQNISNLNELEYISGKIYANVFTTNIIAVISPQDGDVEGLINLEGLNPLPKEEVGEFVLNGIARYKQDNVLIVTGKGWPYVYVIQLILNN